MRTVFGIALAAVIVIACATALIYYYPSSGSIASSTNATSTTAGEKTGSISGYYISVYYGRKLIRKLTLNDLHKLRNYVFVDSRGHEQEGPLFYEVIKYVLGNKTFKYVIVKGQRGNREENLTYAVVSNPKNYIILDYTKQGTVKLCGNENVLPYDKWVKDVTEIIIGR